MKPVRTLPLLTSLLLAAMPSAHAGLHAADMRPSLSVPIIGKGVRQIFADDVLIASKSGVERKVHAAAKLERPVLEASAPWEIGATVKGQPDRRLYIYGTVLRDAASGHFRMWYYTAMTTTHGGALPDKQMAIARAAWRLDGMVSLHAADSEGVIETVPIQPEGDRLFVNADVRTGRLLVEVLDAEGSTVPGFEKSACLP